jgi:hypothetical protein
MIYHNLRSGEVMIFSSDGLEFALIRLNTEHQSTNKDVTFLTGTWKSICLYFRHKDTQAQDPDRWEAEADIAWYCDRQRPQLRW